jgi:chromosome segregation ATPase
VKAEKLSLLNSRLTDENKKLKEKEHDVNENIENSDEKIRSLQSTVDKLTLSEKCLKKELVERDLIINNSQTRIQELEYQKSLLENQKDQDNYITNSRLNNSKNELAEQKSIVQKEKFNQKVLLKKIEDLNNNMNDLQKKYIKMKSLVNVEKDSNKSLKAQLSKTNSIILATEDERKGYLEKIKNFELQNEAQEKEIRNLSIKLSSIMEDNVNLDLNNKKLEKQLITFQDDSNAQNSQQVIIPKSTEDPINNEIAELKSSNQQINIENKRLKIEIGKKEDMITELSDLLKTERSKLVEVIKERSDYFAKNEDLRDQNNDLKRVITQLKSELSLTRSQTN